MIEGVAIGRCAGGMMVTGPLAGRGWAAVLKYLFVVFQGCFPILHTDRPLRYCTRYHHSDAGPTYRPHCAYRPFSPPSNYRPFLAYRNSSDQPRDIRMQYPRTNALPNQQLQLLHPPHINNFYAPFLDDQLHVSSVSALCENAAYIEFVDVRWMEELELLIW